MVIESTFLESPYVVFTVSSTLVRVVIPTWRRALFSQEDSQLIAELH